MTRKKEFLFEEEEDEEEELPHLGETLAWIGVAALGTLAAVKFVSTILNEPPFAEAQRSGSSESKEKPRSRQARSSANVVEARKAARAARILGVSVDATTDEIKAAFRAKVRTVHPDLTQAASEKKTREVIDARDVLVARAEKQASTRRHR